MDTYKKVKNRNTLRAEEFYNDIKEKKNTKNNSSNILEHQNEIFKLISFENTKPLNEKLREIIESVAKTLQVERVSIWNYNENKKSITSENIYLLSKNEYLSEESLQKSDYPKYFQKLSFNNIIDANDAVNDPRTSEFAKNYLIPNGITSMMDTPIKFKGKLIGVICLEHVGPARKWSYDEEVFISTITNIISLSIEIDEIEKFHKEAEEVEKLLVETQAKLAS